MKKTLLSLILLIVLTILVAPVLTLAQGVDVEDAIKANLEPIENVYDPVSDVRPDTFQIIIAKLVRQVLGFLGVIFIVLMLYGGFTWMTAAGAQDRVDRAKKIISAAIIGVALVLVAYAVAYFITTQLLEATGANY